MIYLRYCGELKKLWNLVINTPTNVPRISSPRSVIFEARLKAILLCSAATREHHQLSGTTLMASSGRQVGWQTVSRDGQHICEARVQKKPNKAAERVRTQVSRIKPDDCFPPLAKEPPREQPSPTGRSLSLQPTDRNNKRNDGIVVNRGRCLVQIGDD